MSITLPEAVRPESVGMASKNLSNIDDLAHRFIQEKAYRGVVVLVARHGEICYFKAFGEADQDKPLKKDAVFRLASMSKVPSAVAVMQLFERGQISLHEPVSKYLPEFSEPKVAVLENWGAVRMERAKREITIHDLLSMTAGMTNTWWYNLFTPDCYRVVPKLYKESGLMDDLDAPNITLEDNVKILARMPLIAHPGEMFDYSNNSVETLCRLVEVVSGVDFNRYLQENIFEPLGMRETWFFPPEEELHRVPAAFWAGTGEKHVEKHPLGLGMLGPDYTFSPHKTYFSGAAGLHGTTYDYFRFAQMLLNKGVLEGVRVLSRASVELMTSNQIGDLTNWQLTGNKWGYQLDIQEGVNAPPGSLHYLGGPGAYSWQGFWSTKFVNNPAHDTVIMTMSTPGFDGALPNNLRMIAAAAAAVED
ncbi:CubicO group peptidase, beta-lactamase class C family [Alkalispirochaeta americana]|uniref:CubicO group peptidase, beta-lactamase class C family n=1 Tax=Alkalispirochaeta americana TaxID=159291 RepID=A0A1N6SI36_9SPIO|nr:serine hydrolase domain-containing protein [Alkalispirochaeta americana]SIQ40586.1 CubicO group peptidase, beta-lactamase class C family [Alkalispirochaeta americana]